jgi:hypothetical protein
MITGFEDTELGVDETQFKKAHRLTNLLIQFRSLVLNHRVSLVQTKQEARDSQRLLYREFVKRGLCEPNFSQLHFNAYTFLRSTKSFISCRGNKIAGTLVLVGDGEFGLPSDKLYPKELTRLREQGFRLLEISETGLDHRLFGKHAPVLGFIRNVAALTSLYCGVLNYIKEYSDASHLVVLANIKHKSVYKYIGFAQYGEESNLASDRSIRIPMILNLNRFFTSAENHPPAYLAEQCKKILTPQRSYKFTDADLVARAEFHHEFVKDLSGWQIETLSRFYPRAATTLHRLQSKNNQSRPIEQSHTCKPEFFSNTFSIDQMFIIDNQYKAKRSLFTRSVSGMRKLLSRT